MNAVSVFPDRTPAQGEIIASKFRIERLIARGGDGVVMLATHLQLDERVALKFITSATPERALAEARICLRLKSRHVARVLDIGHHEDRPFIVMEHLEGKDLQTLLAESGRLDDVSEVMELMTQVCEAIAESHRAGIIHRDIKLSNLFLVASRSAVPELKLLDFGIASEGGVSGQTRPAGTLQYMAPEAIQGVADDPRSDLWGLGVVMFELLTGQKPFPSQDAVSLIADIHEAEHPGLRELRPDMPEELEKVIDQCLEKDPAFRYQTAGELAVALRPFAPARAHVDIDRAVELSAEGPSSARALAASSPPSSRRSIAARSSGALRASGSQRLRSPTTRSGSSLALATSAPAGGKRALLYVIAAVALVAVVTTFLVLRHIDSSTTASNAETKSKSTEAVRSALPAVTTATTAAASPSPSPPTAAVPSANVPAPPVTGAAINNAPVIPAWRGSSLPPPRPAAPAVPSTPKKPDDPPAATTASPGSVDKDPWKANKPKLEDNPFK